VIISKLLQNLHWYDNHFLTPKFAKEKVVLALFHQRLAKGKGIRLSRIRLITLFQNLIAMALE
jgi:hypothetical protein